MPEGAPRRSHTGLLPAGIRHEESELSRNTPMGEWTRGSAPDRESVPGKRYLVLRRQGHASARVPEIDGPKIDV